MRIPVAGLAGFSIVIFALWPEQNCSIVAVVNSDITLLLKRVQSGDKSALDRLLPLVYAELSRIAERQLRHERPDHTLQASALVHEAYLKMFRAQPPEFENRLHFYRVVARMMRQILVDYARAHGAEKRAGQAQRVEWGPLTDAEAAVGSGNQSYEMIEIHDALEALAKENGEMAELIELRYFSGLTAEETADLLGKSVHVVRHDLRFAHAWLKRKLST